MRIYAFDLLPWPYLNAPSIHPDPNSLFDPTTPSMTCPG